MDRAGYKIIFIDIDHQVIDELNRRQKYQVIFKSDKDEVVEIENVSGILANNPDAVMKAIAECSLLVTCVGKNAFEKIIPLIAKGIEKRYSICPDFPIDIILAENIREAGKLMKHSLYPLLRDNFPVDSYIGIIETSIGKMVPVMPKEIEKKDPLLVYAEPYNTLILDKEGFKKSDP